MSVDWRGPWWLKPFFNAEDDSMFHRVTAVELAHRTFPGALSRLRHLESVHLDESNITGEQLRILSRLRSLNVLKLEEAVVTPATLEQVIAHRERQAERIAEQQKRWKKRWQQSQEHARRKLSAQDQDLDTPWWDVVTCSTVSSGTRDLIACPASP